MTGWHIRILLSMEAHPGRLLTNAIPESVDASGNRETSTYDNARTAYAGPYGLSGAMKGAMTVGVGAGGLGNCSR